MVKSEYAMGPAIEQYAWMVDLLARASQFDESLEFFKEMPFEPNLSPYGVFVSARKMGRCNKDKNIDEGRGVTKPPDEISAKMNGLYSEIMEIGYVPHNKARVAEFGRRREGGPSVDTTKKLAIAFGLIKTPNGTPLKIIKNPRVWGLP
ncbi:hypothetical protein IFM89_012833 [Coptis chinensis]|uniref:DYW domain-containing protein n=1 Tax=Coptis chinensis TaxID=261450 RepID=A0A835H5V3_9MAGN|nr:hypothetical protein IFM89_012833 [Coptis chinensis]